MLTIQSIAGLAIGCVLGKFIGQFITKKLDEREERLLKSETRGLHNANNRSTTASQKELS